MTYADEFEESRVKRLIHWVGKNGAVLRRRLLITAAAALGLFLLYCVGWLLFGGADASKALIENSIGLSPLDPRAYNWYGDARDTAVTPSVVAARRSINESHLLTLVSNHSEDRMPASVINCGDMLSLEPDTALFYNQLLYDIEKYLAANSHRGPECACAPMLGRPVRLLAFLQQRGAAEEEQLERMASTTNAPYSFTYLLNPEDVYAHQYNELDGNFFSSIGVGMTVEQDSQDYRYNSPRGTYDVLRRSKLTLQVTDKKCDKQRVTIRAPLAVCAARCVDLMNGIDVRERARLQFAKGVKLNKEALAVPQAPAPVLRDEL